MRIAILTVPATGHVNPTLDLAAELVSRGHRVTYLVPEPYGWAARLTGADHAPYSSTLVPTPGQTPPGPEFAVWLPFVLLAEAEQSMPELLRRLRQLSPDVLIFDRMTYLAAHIAAELTGVRAIQFLPSFAYNERFSLIGDLERDTLLNPHHVAHRELRSGLDGFTRSWVTGSIDIEDLLLARWQHAIVAIPSWFQPRGETFPDTYTFTGPALAVRRSREPSGPAADGPEIYASLGTAFTGRTGTVASIIRAIEASGRPGLLATGVPAGSIPDQDAVASSPQVRIAGRVDQLAALRRAKVFITHAGMGSVQEAIAFGVPMICLPHTTEQQAVARRVVQLGLGERLDPEVTAAGLTDAIDRVSRDTELHRRSHRLAELMTSTRPGVVGADAVESILQLPNVGPSAATAGSPEPSTSSPGR